VNYTQSMSTITSLRSTTARSTAPREIRQLQTAVAAAPPKDSANLSSEATTPGEIGSVPSFAARVPTRDLPHRMPRTETPEQKKARTKRELREVDAIGREMDRSWKANGGGVMKPAPGSPEARPPKLQSSGLPHRMPRTETPEQRQARLDRECAAMRELERIQKRRFRPIMASESGRPG
jgi:hypothetical protein